MIIKNVIVYTEDKKFTAGGIVVHDDKIESITRQKTYRICRGKKSLTDRGHTQFRD